MKDWHIHTIYSDGEYDEKEIVDRILKTKIDDFAICDHDTIVGSQKVYNVLKEKGIDNISFHTGVEFSCRIKSMYGGINVHLLVRDFEFDDKNILYLIKKISKCNKKKREKMAKFIHKVYGIKFTKEEIDDIEKTTCTLGKPHMYKLLCKYGDFDREQYYKKMNDLRTIDFKLDAEEVINRVHKGKGKVTLAHPIEIMEDYNLHIEDVENVVKYLKSVGLDAIETKHSKHDKKMQEIFSHIAEKYDLMQTSGSDYHGPDIKPNVKLGVCEKM